MITENDAADWMTLAAAWRLDRGLPANREIASAKLYASEMLARVTDEAVQIHSPRGRAAALTHTASIAGADAGADAFLRRLGFARADGIPELLETLKLLHVHGPLDGPRLGAMCCSGGEASILADAAEDAGVVLPELTNRHAVDVPNRNRATTSRPPWHAVAPTRSGTAS